MIGVDHAGRLVRVAFKSADNNGSVKLRVLVGRSGRDGHPACRAAPPSLHVIERAASQPWEPHTPTMESDEREAASRYRRMLDAFAAAAVSAAVLAALRAGVKPGKIAKVITGGWQSSGVEAKVWQSAGKVAARQVGGEYIVTSGRAAAIKWAETQSARLLVDVTSDTAGAVRELVAAGTRNGWSVTRTADELSQVVGLRERQRVALGNYRAALTGDGANPTVIERKVGRMRDRMIRDRAVTIARTELLAAANAGRYQTWLDLGITGRKEWLTAPGACPTCQPLNGVRVKLDARFSTGDLMPPAHPRCRCTAVAVDA